VGELATPCIGDDGVSLSFAASQQDTGLKVADSAEANSTSLTDVCSAVDASGVVLVYASGVRLAESPNGSADPKTAWQALVDQYPDAGYELTTFDGQPALQIPAGGPLDSPGAVMWVEERQVLDHGGWQDARGRSLGCGCLPRAVCGRYTGPFGNPRG
jgi:hypothetical protein